MRPIGEKAIVLIEKEYIKEKGKQIMNEDGSPRYEIGQEGKVLSSNIDGVKKGDKVICDFRGGFSIMKSENKKGVTVIFDKDEIHAVI